jgi:hypothetical protein
MMECFVELVKSGNSQILKCVNLVKFGEGFGHVSVIIPQGVIEVEEEVLVSFQGKSASISVVLNFVDGQFPVGF